MKILFLASSFIRSYCVYNIVRLRGFTFTDNLVPQYNFYVVFQNYVWVGQVFYYQKLHEHRWTIKKYSRFYARDSASLKCRQIKMYP